MFLLKKMYLYFQSRLLQFQGLHLILHLMLLNHLLINQSNLPTKRVKLRTIESLKGDDIGGEFYFDYPIPKNFSKPDDRQPDYRRAEEPLLPPEIGALKIVMLINPTGEGYRTHHNLNGVLVGTPENIARVKAVTEAQKRYFDDFYKLDPASKKYWEEEYKRQREAMVNPDSF